MLLDCQQKHYSHSLRDTTEKNILCNWHIRWVSLANYSSKYRSLKIGESIISQQIPLPGHILPSGSRESKEGVFPHVFHFLLPFHKQIMSKFGSHWERWRWMFPFVTLLLSLFRRDFVSFPVKLVHVRCAGCKGERNSRKEEGKLVGEGRGVVRYQPKKHFYLKKMNHMQTGVT